MRGGVVRRFEISRQRIPKTRVGITERAIRKFKLGGEGRKTEVVRGALLPVGLISMNLRK